MIKRLLIAVVLLAIVAGGLVGFNLFRANAIKQFFATRTAPAVTVSVVVAKKSRWSPSLDAIGTANAAHGVDLAVETTGVVKQILFEANQTVEADSILLQLDDAVQRADLQAQRAQAALDSQALQRASELQKRGVGSEVNLQSAQAAASSSQSQVARYEAVLQQKQLRAPFGGKIGIPRVDIGEYVAIGTVIATLQDLDTMRADFTVPEQQMPEIGIGQSVEITLSGLDTVFHGSIEGIDPKVDPASRLVSVRASIGDAHGRLTPGQFVQIKVLLPPRDGVIAVPQTALITSLYGDYVYVVKPAAAQEQDAKASQDGAGKLEVRQVFVTAGSRSAGLVEIATGVSEGDQVVTAGQNRLFNGAPVTIGEDVDLSGSSKAAAK